jgi:carboxyl-terminal processing protease
MKKIFLLLLATVFLQTVEAQIPDDTNGRLYRLCKTWGFFKYFHQKKCTIKWDTLLNTTVNQVLLASSNAEFNDILLGMFNKVGNNSFQANPPAPPDTNFNVDIGWINDPVFSQPVRDFLNTFSSFIYPDTSTCFMKINDFSTGSYYSYIDFRNDPLSMPINYTNEANRLTTVFYYWNVINYFSPNRQIMDQPWDSTLSWFIPRIRQATTIDDFHIMFLKLATKINDSHGLTDSPRLEVNFWKGNYIPKIYFKRVENKCVVRKVQDIAGIKRGDILIAIDGISIQKIEDSLSQFVPASTPAALYRDIYYSMLNGLQNSNITFSLLDSANNSYSVSTLRLTNSYAWFYDDESPLSYFITSCGYGYVNMGNLKREELSAMYTALKNTSAIILDLRYPPNVSKTELAKLFFREPVASAIVYDPALKSMYSPFYLPGWYYKHDDRDSADTWLNANPYNGKVYMLVNEETQSYMEYDCQYLSYHPNAKVIGTQTAGADGNVSYLNLPGSITTKFTSLGWYYADEYQQQRNGVKIDSIVPLTINGIRQGRDEILNAALDCLTGSDNVTPAKYALTVCPNPVSSGAACVTFTLEKHAVVRLSLFDINGRMIRQMETEALPGENSVVFELDSAAAGMYVLVLSSEFASVTTDIVIM